MYFVYPDGRYDDDPGDITMKLVNRKDEEAKKKKRENKQAISSLPLCLAFFMIIFITFSPIEKIWNGRREKEEKIFSMNRIVSRRERAPVCAR